MNFNITDKLGKFPVWVWGVFVAVAGLGIYFVYSRKTAASTTTSTTTLDPNGYQTAGINGGSAANANSIVSSDNNQSWLSRAAKAVSDTLQVSPSSVYAALQKWSTGQDITTTEKGYVDKALSIVGNPPESIQGTSSVISTDKQLVSLTRSIGSATGAVYAHWSDGSTTWVSAQQIGQLSTQKPITDTLSNGNPVVRWVKRPGSVAVYAFDANGTSEWVNAGAYSRAGTPVTVAQ